METEELAELARRVQAGDSVAAVALVRATRDVVWCLVRAYFGRFDGAEDMTQEVYATLFARLHRYQARHGVPFEHWLSRMTVNLCRDRLRSESRRRRWLADAPPIEVDAQRWLERAGSGAMPLDDAVMARDLVQRILDELDPDDRVVLTLLELEEYSSSEVADLLGWTATRVRVRALRARGKLRAAIDALAERERLR